MNLDRTFSRRNFLGRASQLTVGAFCGGRALRAGNTSGAERPRGNPKVAAVFTEFRFRSHAYNILENCFEPYLFRGELVAPGIDVVSFYADQFPQDDMAREVSRRLDVPLFESIEAALTLGGKELAVDAVLSIGEHGDYPYNDLGQKMYPRKRFFDEEVAVMQRSGRFVPIFNDKHLSYRWDWAKAMSDTARRHGIPLLAGSSVPLAQRIPPLELPADADIEEAVSIHGGGIESYDFHGLEVLQSFVEGRRGGETGVSQVQLLTGDAFRRASKQGRWSQDLVDAALAAEKAMPVRRGKRPRRGVPQRPQPKHAPPKRPGGPHALVLTYKDGFRATVLRIGGDSSRWNFACRLKGETEPRATALFNGPWGNRCLFKALSHAIQHLFRTREAPYPVERTLLVSGILDAAMHSLKRGGEAIATPHLEFAYTPSEFGPFRENGASWKRLTAETPQPIRFQPGDGTVLGARRKQP